MDGMWTRTCLSASWALYLPKQGLCLSAFRWSYVCWSKVFPSSFDAPVNVLPHTKRTEGMTNVKSCTLYKSQLQLLHLGVWCENCYEMSFFLLHKFRDSRFIITIGLSNLSATFGRLKFSCLEAVLSKTKLPWTQTTVKPWEVELIPELSMR